MRLNNTDVARELWGNGEALEAGRLVYERVGSIARPFWAEHLLHLAVSRLDGPAPAAVMRTASVARCPMRWSSGHRAFSEVRHLTLELEEQSPTVDSPKYTLYLTALIAELVAKVTYNATHPTDPFDDDNGWWLVKCMRDLVDKVAEQDFETIVWTTITRHPIISTAARLSAN